MSSLVHRVGLNKVGEAIGNATSTFMPYVNSGVETVGHSLHYVGVGVSYGVNQVGTSILQAGAAVYAGGCRFLQPADGTLGVLAPVGRVTLLLGGAGAGIQGLRELGTALRAKQAADRMLAGTRSALWFATSAVGIGLSMFFAPIVGEAPTQTPGA